MFSFSIVPDFNKLKHGKFCLAFGLEVLMIYHLGFHCFEKAFCNRVVPAIPFSAHTLIDMGIVQALPEFIAGILNAPVRMKYSL